MANIILNTDYDPGYETTYLKRLKAFKDDGNMSFTNFTEAVNWLKEGPFTENICLTGTEPLMHPLFDDLAELLKIKKEEQQIIVSTNGEHIAEHTDALCSLQAHVIVRLSSPAVTGTDAYEKTIEGIKLLRLKGLSVSLSIEVNEPGLDMSFCFDVIKEFGIKDLEIVVPAGDSEKNAEDYLNKLEPEVISLVEKVSALGAETRLGCHYLPICHTLKHVNKLEALKEKDRVNNEIVGCSNCLPVLDIMPSLRIARCYGMMTEGLLMPLKAFKMAHEARNFFATNIDYVAQLIPMDTRCVACYDKAVGNCQGGCMAFKLDRFLNTQSELKKIVALPTREIEIDL